MKSRVIAALSTGAILSVGTLAMVAQAATPLAVSCAGTPNGSSITWSASTTGGVAPIALSWGNGATTSTTSVSYAGYGARTMQLQATDASSTVATTTCAASIAQPVPTIVSFFANPLTIFAGGTTTLSWNVQNASSTSLSSPLGTGSVSASGTSVVSPGTTTTYILTAVNPGGTATTSAKVTVLPVNNGTTTPPASTTTVPIIRKPNLVISHNNHFVANNAIVTSVASTSFTAKIFGINVTVVSNKPVTVGNYVNVVGTLNPDTMTVTAKMVQQFASSKVVFNKTHAKEQQKNIKEAIKDLKEQRKEQEKHIKETLKDLKEQLKFAKH